MTEALATAEPYPLLDEGSKLTVRLLLPTASEGETVASLLKSDLGFFLGTDDKGLVEVVSKELVDVFRYAFTRIGLSVTYKTNIGTLYGYKMRLNFKPIDGKVLGKTPLRRYEIVALTEGVLKKYGACLRCFDRHDANKVEVYFS